MVTDRPHPTVPHRRGRAGWLLLFAVAVAGVAMMAVGLAGQQSPPRPDTTAGTIPTGTMPASTVPADTATPTRPDSAPVRPVGSASGHVSASSGSAGAPVLGRSRPIHLTIPRIGVDTAVTTVGLNRRDAIAVPHGKHQNQAAWFDHSPTPGQYGAAVIVGHIDTRRGPSVFYRLGALRPDDTIIIDRANHQQLVFTVEAVRVYPDRTALPAGLVYAGWPDRAGLRLITCADFDHHSGHYRGNTIVYAQLRTTSPR